MINNILRNIANEKKTNILIAGYCLANMSRIFLFNSFVFNISENQKDQIKFFEHIRKKLILKFLKISPQIYVELCKNYNLMRKFDTSKRINERTFKTTEDMLFIRGFATASLVRFLPQIPEFQFYVEARSFINKYSYVTKYCFNDNDQLYSVENGDQYYLFSIDNFIQTIFTVYSSKLLEKVRVLSKSSTLEAGFMNYFGYREIQPSSYRV